MNRRTLHRHLLYTPWYLRLLKVLKSIKVKSGQTSLYRILVIFIDSLKSNEIFSRANGVAFSFTLAIFPTIIFTFTLIPYIHSLVPDVDEGNIMQFLSQVMPPAMYEVASDTIHDIVSIKRQGLLSFGALFALILATNGMSGLMNAFNSCYRTSESRGFIRSRLVATALTVVLAFVLFLAIILLVIGQALLNYLFTFGVMTEDFIYYLILFMRFMVVLISFFIAVSMIYYFAPAIHKRWRFFSAGSMAAAMACVAASFAFSFYINNFGTYNKLYGSLGMLIALMIWLYILSTILLVGFEFNASIDRAVSKEVVELSEKV